MPLFHSNALLAGWSVAVGSGAAMVPATFSASGLLSDLRRYGVTYLNYVGKPLAYVLATPERPDDADNPLRVAFGNEASDRDIAEFSRRFDCTVWDGFGSTEGAIIITREDGCPPGSLGQGFPGVSVYNPDTLAECPVARFDNDGALINADEAIGELVNTSGAGLFAGYYNDQEATDARLRHGMFWSGDLAYRDADGWIYFAGRSGDWLRVDGENMTTAPIERILQRLPAVRGVRRVFGRPARPIAQGVAAPCVDHRRPAVHRHQQNPQARTELPGLYTGGWPAVDPDRTRQHLCRGRSGGHAAAEIDRARCPGVTGMRILMQAFGDIAADLA
jgi:fatty-acyl-CoA synthase